MIHYIRGYITETMPGMVAIESNGIAYEVYVPDGSPAFLAQPDEEMILYTSMQVSEDDVRLFGFTDKESKALFRLLQTVSGVGAKAALAMLSAFPNAAELKRAIYFEDDAAITRANGVGKKTAQRVVLELKDKVGEIPAAPGTNAAAKTPKKGSPKDEALQALLALGYGRTEALGLLSGITQEDLTAEEYIKQALRARR